MCYYKLSQELASENRGKNFLLSKFDCLESLKSKDFRINWIKKRNYLRRPYSNLGTLFIVSGVRTRGAPTTLFVTYLYELQTL